VHAQAFGLDQVPEALLPLVVAQPQLGLTAIEIAGIVLAFVILELLLSRVFFELRIREQPY
jgi:CDP-2,3-bis-(O-geranylgeranyl)-sn-glycerol synthase